MPLVDQNLLETAFDYFNDYADAAARARADLTLAERRIGITRAKLMLQSPEKSADMRRAWAESHADYIGACEEEARAAKEVEWHRHQRARADAITNVYQTESANRRGLARVA